MEKEFIASGKDRKPFEDAAREVGGFLWRRAYHLQRKQGGPAPLQPPTPAKSNGRVVYVAKPAVDMLRDYDRVVRELQYRNYVVIAEPGADIPAGDAASTFIEENLAKAEASIHLLGDESGDRRDGGEPLVASQLKHAAAKVRTACGGTAGRRGFRRFVWAPELLSLASGTQAGSLKRVATEVLKRFDKFLPTDEVVGGDVGEFIDLVARKLDGDVASTVDESDPPPVAGAPKVYVYHRYDDRPYARRVAKALPHRERLNIILPPVEANPDESALRHHQELLRCDSVVLCLGDASDFWARTSADELDWRKLGRTRQFSRRSLVVGPPTDDAKSDLVEFGLPEIDVVVPTSDPPAPSELEKLLNPPGP